jgi:hypothetical protein
MTDPGSKVGSEKRVSQYHVCHTLRNQKEAMHSLLALDKQGRITTRVIVPLLYMKPICKGQLRAIASAEREKPEYLVCNV